MEIRTEDYEKLGAFYLGREFDVASQRLEERLVLYDSRDLVTHGVVLGMTGSGKTGLCLAMLEEAAIDGIPALVIDPKGDIANLLLTFPSLEPADFRPWINPDDASRKGMTPDAFAAAQADLWKNGLAEWGQDGERIRRLREKVEIDVYTPGSSAGIPVSILSSLETPPFEIVDDAELFGERIESTVSGILSLLGVEADPIRSREHILLSSILGALWRDGRDVDLGSLIRAIQQPPFTQIGVLDVESFFPESKRYEFALQINNLLAAPGFATWMSGVPLDVGRMLHGADGRPRIGIFSIAHLGESERMFFVSMLLNQFLGWMRGQPGTTSLRALLYMDEIFGYLPPTANPPSKKPMLTLLKQARAFGVGLLVATQNPVDLDYKALSNIGTWFLGRLQTERDKARVLDGLEGAAAGGKFDRARVEKLLSALGNRVFLLHNVHDDGPVTFQVRWVMSYLRGPLTRAQIKGLVDPRRDEIMGRSAAKPEAAGSQSAASAPAAAGSSAKPSLPRGIDEFHLVGSGRAAAQGAAAWEPAILVAGEAFVDQPKKGVRGTQRYAFLVPIGDGAVAADWQGREAIENGMKAVATGAPEGGEVFAALPPAAIRKETYRAAEDAFEEWVYRHGGVEVLYSPTLDLYGSPGEDEGEFRGRLALAAREERDRQVAELREGFRNRIQRIEGRLAKAREAVAREKEQAGRARMDGLLSAGAAVLGALMGRRKIGVTTITRGKTAVRSASKAWKESDDVGRAEEKAESIEEELNAMEEEAENAVRQLEARLDPLAEKIETVHLKPYKKDIKVKACGLVWVPA